jgi:hypothetical protein
MFHIACSGGVRLCRSFLDSSVLISPPTLAPLRAVPELRYPPREGEGDHGIIQRTSQAYCPPITPM